MRMETYTSVHGLSFMNVSLFLLIIRIFSEDCHDHKFITSLAMLLVGL